MMGSLPMKTSLTMEFHNLYMGVGLYLVELCEGVPILEMCVKVELPRLLNFKDSLTETACNIGSLNLIIDNEISKVVFID